MNKDLTTLNWVGVAGPLGSSSLLITPTNGAAFYRVIGK
jgi:hypothetical protein